MDSSSVYTILLMLPGDLHRTYFLGLVRTIQIILGCTKNNGRDYEQMIQIVPCQRCANTREEDEGRQIAPSTPSSCAKSNELYCAAALPTAVSYRWGIEVHKHTNTSTTARRAAGGGVSASAS